jgi:hypothetical protein
MAELARKRERSADAGLVNAGLYRAQRLAREAGAPRELVLSQAARDTSTAHHRTICHHTCQLARIMA